MNKPVAIVLGGTVPHKFLIENLRKRGYQTLLIDYYDNPPAASVADRHIKKSTLDQDAVLQIVKQEKASLVISGCVDQANVTACYVAEKLGLPAPYSYETALRVTDKALMKAGMVNAGVPTATHEVVTADQINSYHCDVFPKVVKPCDCNGSKGVRKVGDQQELLEALKTACKLSRTGKAIVESFNSGVEVSGYFYVGRDDISLLYVKEKSKNSPADNFLSFVSIGPFSVSSIAAEVFVDAVRKISLEFNLFNTPLLVQANIDEEVVKVIEFAPRVGGGLAFREIKTLTGFDIIESVVGSYLGENIESNDLATPEGMISIVHLYGEKGRLSHIEGMSELIADGVVEEFHMHKTPGMEMSCSDFSSRNRVLGVIIYGTDINEINSKYHKILKKIKIINTDGNDVLNINNT